jgi:hypothetical protein
MLKMVHVLFEGMRKQRIEDPLTYSTLGISLSSECCLSKLLLANWMWQRCAYTWWCLGVVPEDDPYGKKKIHERNLVLYIFPAVVVHAQVCLRLTAQLLLSLLHVSAENHNHLQGPIHVCIYCIYSWCAHRLSNVESPFCKHKRLILHHQMFQYWILWMFSNFNL